MAIEDSNTAQKSTDSKPTAAQIDVALNEITQMAQALNSVCECILDAGDKSGYLSLAAAKMALQIGWTADRCLGLGIRTTDEWMLSPRWESMAESESTISA
jgi:hypothetical protein